MPIQPINISTNSPEMQELVREINRVVEDFNREIRRLESFRLARLGGNIQVK